MIIGLILIVLKMYIEHKEDEFLHKRGIYIR